MLKQVSLECFGVRTVCEQPSVYTEILLFRTLNNLGEMHFYCVLIHSYMFFTLTPMKFCLNVQSQWLIVMGGKDAITDTRV